jgi:hypothetical protein
VAHVIPDGEADPGPCAAKSHKVPALHLAPAGMTVGAVRVPITTVIPDGAADPGPRVAKSTKVPALRFASAGMTVGAVRVPITTVFPDGAADPGPRVAKSTKVPALRFASAGMTVIFKSKTLPTSLANRDCSFPLTRSSTLDASA